MGLRKLVAGNWKMHGTSADIGEIEAIAAASLGYPDVEVALCVPATLVDRAARAVPKFAIGAQDVHFAEQGAYTGCVSAGMLRDAGTSLTIVGHSERREAQHESDADVCAKAAAALAAGIDVILCVGESLGTRKAGGAVATVDAQLQASLPDRAGPARLAIAYEPIWAIGTGMIPSTGDIAEMHGALRRRLIEAYGESGRQIRILYGGSVKASNAGEIFKVANVDGALVGGASLKAGHFVPIIAAAVG